MLITRIILGLYGFIALGMLVRVLAVQFVGKNPEMKSVWNVLFFPFLLMTEKGRTRLSQTLELGEKK